MVFKKPKPPGGRKGGYESKAKLQRQGQGGSLLLKKEDEERVLAILRRSGGVESPRLLADHLGIGHGALAAFLKTEAAQAAKAEATEGGCEEYRQELLRATLEDGPGDPLLQSLDDVEDPPLGYDPDEDSRGFYIATTLRPKQHDPEEDRRSFIQYCKDAGIEFDLDEYDAWARASKTSKLKK
jgi:hypothetical protein